MEVNQRKINSGIMDHLKVTRAFSLIPVILVAALLPVRLAVGDEVNFYTFPAPPYQIVNEIPGPDQDVRGLTVNTVRCATAGAGLTANVRAVPQPRAIEFLRKELIDGYFAVDPSTALDVIAVRTDPVSLEKWHLVSRAGDQKSGNPRIGAVIGSNEEAWLQSSGKDIFLSVRTPQQLVALLLRGRIDLALMDRRVLQSLENNAGLDSEFLRYAPLHAYLSRRFVARNPEFMDTFNRQIPTCINGTFVLDESETAIIRGLAYDLYREIKALLPLAEAIENGPAPSSLSEILNLDAQWRALAPTHYSDMARTVADLPASGILRDWQNRHQTLITEIMLTNSVGTLVAMSRLTSDFWQGDEPKFDQHINSGSRNIFVSPIRYDASTSRFQVTVSFPINIEGRWLPAGVLVFGLDVERALTAENNTLQLTGPENH